MFTTLNKLVEYNLCKDKYEHLLKCLGKTQADDDPLSIRTILEYNGVYDAIWALLIDDKSEREIRLFACDLAESVFLHIFRETYPNSNKLRNAIDVARKYANSEVEITQLTEAYLDVYIIIKNMYPFEAETYAANAVMWVASQEPGFFWLAWDAAWDAYRVNRDSLDEKNIRELLLKYI